MSGRLVTARLATLARRTALHTPRSYTTRSLPAGGLLRNEAGLRLIKRRPWPVGSYALHNLPATRSISFARVVPKLVTKLATAGAAAGGAVIAGVSYIQYQAGRTYNPELVPPKKLTAYRGGGLCARPLPPHKRRCEQRRRRRVRYRDRLLRPDRPRLAQDKRRA